MTDLLTLWETPDPPTPEARRRARAALLRRAAGRRNRRPLLRASLAVATLAVAAAIVVAQNLGGSGRAIPTASALERAASAAQQRPFTAPRADQWIYTADRLGDVTIERWHRADGNGFAQRGEDGKLQMIDSPRKPGGSRGPGPGPFASYQALAALPTDPDALLRWVYEEGENVEGAGSTPDAEAFALLTGLLSGGAVPPDLEAALFRAIEKLPGVTVSTVDVLGEPTLSVELTDDWLRQEILLDPRSYRYRGTRATAIKQPPPQKGGRKGSVVVAERVGAGVVDRPGERA